jgi:HAD superfamily hydrolase (TIGR01450 family)
VAWILDLDGVIWRGELPVAGSADAVARLRRAGEQVVFVTNNSSLTRADYLAKLARMGIPAGPDDLFTSGMAAAQLLDPGCRALVLGGEGVREALGERGIVDADGSAPADAVVVGWHRDFGFDSLAAGMRAILAGARFVATNDDPSYPAEDGVLPGCGAIVAFLATAAGQQPEVAGKPNPPMVTVVRERLGAALDGSTFVGDRLSTDGAMARALGVRFVLVRTGVDDQHNMSVVVPDEIADDLAAAVARALGQP